MEREPRADKVAVVSEIRERFENADAVLLTEYRGLKVSELAALRKGMLAGGGEYKVYKNTLVRRAAADLNIDFGDTLTGPVALAFVTGDIAAVAKSITEFEKSNPKLVLKGGLLGDKVLDQDGAKALASLPTASEIYARLAGAVNGNARGLASVIHGVHRSIAYVLQAAIDSGAFADGGAPAAPSSSDEPAAAAATEPAGDPAPESEES